MQTPDDRTLDTAAPPSRVPADRRAAAILAATVVTLLTAFLGLSGGMGQDRCSGEGTFGCSTVGEIALGLPLFVSPVVLLGLFVVSRLGATLGPASWWRAYWTVCTVQALAVVGFLAAVLTMA